MIVRFSVHSLGFHMKACFMVAAFDRLLWRPAPAAVAFRLGMMKILADATSFDERWMQGMETEEYQED